MRGLGNSSNWWPDSRWPDTPQVHTSVMPCELEERGNNLMEIDPKSPLLKFMRLLLSRIDGLLLFALIALFLTFAALPSIPVLLGLVSNVSSGIDMRITFLIMPLALIAEYLWFASSSGGQRFSLLLCFALVATAAIPFIKSICRNTHCV
jgi:hypothetical protein